MRACTDRARKFHFAREHKNVLAFRTLQRALPEIQPNSDGANGCQIAHRHKQKRNATGNNLGQPGRYR